MPNYGGLVGPPVILYGDAFGVVHDVVIVNDAATDGSTTTVTCNTSKPFVPTDVGKTVLLGAPGATGQRTDTGVTITSGLNTITDASASTADIGKMICGLGIPIGNWVIGYSGTTLTMAYPATSSAGTAVTISTAVQTTIASVISSSQITLAAGAATGANTAQSGLVLQFGHYDTPAINAALAALGTSYQNQLLSGAAPPAYAELVLSGGNSFIDGVAGIQPPKINFTSGTMRIRGAGLDVTKLITTGGINYGSPMQPAAQTVVGGTTINSAVVTCAAAQQSWVGCGLTPIASTAISLGSQIVSVVTGVSFTMNFAANATTSLSVVLQFKVPRMDVRDLTMYDNYLGVAGGAAGGRLPFAALFQAFPPPFQNQVPPCYPAYASGYQGLNSPRNDAGCTIAGTAVTDANAQSSDVGAVVTDTTTPANIPAGTVIVAVNPGVGFTLSQAGTASSGQTLAIGNYAIATATTATTLSDTVSTATMPWTAGQWVGGIVFIDEDKATAATGDTANIGVGAVGAGYAYITGNTGSTVTHSGWISTRGGGVYVPSGQTPRYRLQTAVYQASLHDFERVRFYGSRGFVGQASFMNVRDCLVDQCGQPFDLVHNDSFGGGGCTANLENVTWNGGAGTFADFSGIFPGLFPTLNMTGCNALNGHIAGAIYCGGISTVITGNNLQTTSAGGVGFDSTDHESNRGNTTVTGNFLGQMNVNGSGLSSARGDRVSNNIASDSPLGIITAGNGGWTPANVVPPSGSAFKNPYNACDCMVLVTASLNSPCTVALNGVTYAVIAQGASLDIPVASGVSITLTYTVAPTWVWVGN